LDDLHWADAATIALTRAVAREATRSRVLVVATYRDTDLDRRHPLAQALPVIRREVEPVRVALDGLGQDDVQQLLERLAAHEVPTEFAELLTNQTEGNPFFIREMLLHLTEAGLLRFEQGGWVVDAGVANAIPEGVREVVGKRLSGLSEEANRLLTVGALFEVAFMLPAAADVAGLDEDEALDAVDAALAARIIEPGGAFDEYRFTHALFRQTLAEELNPSRTVRMHRAIAEVLEKRLLGEASAAAAASIARHWHLSAALPGSDRGVPYALAVAREAIERFAPSEAYEAYDMALEMLPDGDDRQLELRSERLHAGLLAGIGTDVALGEAEELGRLIAVEEGPDRAADLLARLARVANGLGDSTLTWALARVGRQWLDADRRDGTWVALRTFELDEADYLDPEHPGIPLESADRREIQQTIERLPASQRMGIMIGPSSREVAERFVREAAAEGVGPASRFPSMWAAGQFTTVVDDFVAKLDDGRIGGSHQSEVFVLAVLARTAAALGRHEIADRSLARGFEVLPRIPDNTNPAFQLFAAQRIVDFLRGVPLSPTDLALFGEFITSPSTRWAALAVEAANALAYAQQDQPDEALEVLDRLVVGVERAGGWAPNYPFIVCNAATVLWELQSDRHADVIEDNLRRKMLEPDLRYDMVESRRSLAHLCAVTGRTDEARRWFAESRDALHEDGRHALLVSVDHDEALLELRLGTDGDPDRCANALSSARSGCEHPAMAPWLERLDELDAKTAEVWG
ncbi:MAG TPA: hypothetical protein VD926_04860, partial [Acidimicrobiales bacterium]|nr:hypothetical protein [Acidimicrobiales bacterium]